MYSPAFILNLKAIKYNKTVGLKTGKIWLQFIHAQQKQRRKSPQCHLHYL